MLTQCFWCRYECHCKDFMAVKSKNYRRNRWRGLWVVLQESYVLGISPKTGEVRVVMLFDKGHNRFN